MNFSSINYYVSSFGLYVFCIGVQFLFTPNFSYCQANQYSVCFDGINDFISVPNSPTLTFGENSFTFELWFKKDLTSHPHQTNLITNYKVVTVPFVGVL